MGWADCGLAKEEGHLRPEWSDSEEGEVHTISLSEYNVNLLSSLSSSTLSNSEQRKVRNSFPAPDVFTNMFPMTRMPTLNWRGSRHTHSIGYAVVNSMLKIQKGIYKLFANAVFLCCFH